jgi:hypothetical protein
MTVLATPVQATSEQRLAGMEPAQAAGRMLSRVPAAAERPSPAGMGPAQAAERMLSLVPAAVVAEQP